MPIALVFVACEKIVIAKDDNNPTLIALLSQFGGEVQLEQAPTASPFPVPMRWQIFTMWEKEPADEGKEFEQTVRFLSPSGRNYFVKQGEADTPLAFTLKGQTHRVNATISVLPIGENGKWRLDLFLREKGQPDWPSEPVRSYPLHLDFTVKIEPAQ